MEGFPKRQDVKDSTRTIFDVEAVMKIETTLFKIVAESVSRSAQCFDLGEVKIRQLSPFRVWDLVIITAQMEVVAGQECCSDAGREHKLVSQPLARQLGPVMFGQCHVSLAVSPT